MYEFRKPKLKSKGVEEVILEVISTNTPAIKSYEKIGFKIERELSCFSGELIIKRENTQVNIEKLDYPNLIKLSTIGEIKPTWQNSNETIKNLYSDALILAATIDSEFVGYLVVNKNNNRILQIAVKEEFRKKSIGSSLLKYIADNISKKTSIINVDSYYHSTLSFLRI